MSGDHDSGGPGNALVETRPGPGWVPGLLLIARLVVGVAFIWMGLAKVADPVDFLKLLRVYEVVPEQPPWMLNGLAATLPWLEIWCGGLLLLGIGVRGTALVLAVMLAVFTSAIVQRALDVQTAEQLAFCAIQFDCGCGGGEVNICRKLAQNSGLALLAVSAALSGRHRFALRPRLRGRRS